MNVVKTELLWTRVCPLKCDYCGMADGRRNTVLLEQWKEGVDNLKKLDCKLIAIYGAEPLHDFDKLPEVIQYAESLGIYTTVITSGVTDNVDKKLVDLYAHGLRSITTSYDYVGLDRYSKIKTNNALNIIKSFRSLGPTRDAAVVVTLTRQNFKYLPDIIREMSKEGIWTFFDLIHPDEGQPGSKVKNTNLDLLFKPEDWISLVKVLNNVLALKEARFLCHTSKEYIETLKIVASYISTAKVKASPYIWNCGMYDCFPSWLTVDCDGTVYPCDSFQPKNVSNIKIWEIAELWYEFCRTWKPVVKERCPGCLWNTHMDAHLIKRGLLPITGYIHNMDYSDNG